MPKFFFNTHDGERYPDEDGTELPDAAAARLKATVIMAELLKEQPRDFLNSGRLRVEVTDEAQRTLMVLDASLTCRAA